MKKSIFVLAVISLLMLIAVLGAPSVTVTKPASGAIVSGSNFGINASVSGFSDTRNCTWSVSSATGVNTSSGSILTVANLSGNQAQYNGTFDSTLLQDSNDWVFTATCWNGSTSATSSGVTGIIVDHTIPSCTDDTGFTSGSTVSPTATWSVTGSNSTRNKAYLNIGSNTYALTDSASGFANIGKRSRTLASSFTGNIPESLYTTAYLSVSDGTNLTSCTALSNIKIKDSENAQRGKIIYAMSNEGRVSQSGSTFSVSPPKSGLEKTLKDNAGLIIIGIGAYFLLRKKGKR